MLLLVACLVLLLSLSLSLSLSFFVSPLVSLFTSLSRNAEQIQVMTMATPLKRQMSEMKGEEKRSVLIPHITGQLSLILVAVHSYIHSS